LKIRCSNHRQLLCMRRPRIRRFRRMHSTKKHRHNNQREAKNFVAAALHIGGCTKDMDAHRTMMIASTGQKTRFCKKRASIAVTTPSPTHHPRFTTRFKTTPVSCARAPTVTPHHATNCRHATNCQTVKPPTVKPSRHQPRERTEP
jgi:hypothetical protein